MRVAQFTDTFLPVVDGVGRVVSHYAQTMGDLCEACYVIAPRQEGFELQSAPYELIDYRSIRLPKMPQYRAGLPGLDARCRRRLTTLKLDIAHAHSPFVAGREAYRVARRQGIPLVATFHSKYYEDFYQLTKSKSLSKLGVKFVVEFFSKCDQVWAVSHATADVLRDYGYRGVIEVVENGSNRKEPSAAAARMAEERYGLGDVPVLLFVGQMNWKKNIRRILEAVEVLARQGREFRLVLAGQGPSEKEIRQLSSAMGLEHFVVHVGHVSDAELLEGLYNRADLLVFPSLYDSAPMVVREAAAVGTPSLLALGSSAAEVVRDGENGLLAHDTTKDMAERIAWALDHPEELKQIGSAARRTIPKPWKDIVVGVLERYASLIRTTGNVRRF